MAYGHEGGLSMKAKNLIILSAGALMLAGCGSSGIHLFEPVKAETWVAGSTWLYVRGNLTGYSTNPSWAVSDDFKMTITSKSYGEGELHYIYEFKGLILNVGDTFKLGDSDFGQSLGYSVTTEISHYYVQAGASDNNIECAVAGTYDVYMTTNFQNKGTYNISVVKEAKDLLLKQDLEYTRTTGINLSETGLATVKAHNYFENITKNRVTYFLDGGLYMREVGGTDVNSGYYTKTSEPNKMYHFSLSGGSDTYNQAAATMANQRLDSATVGVNDFYYGAHYFHDNAATVAALFSFDVDNSNYYSAAATAGDDLVTKFMYFTAPLFTNSTGEEVVFNGIGLKDLGPTQTNFYTYTSDATLLAADANTVFGVAELTNIGSTAASVPWFSAYIAA
jgi:hypothetical protein